MAALKRALCCFQSSSKEKSIEEPHQQRTCGLITRRAPSRSVLSSGGSDLKPSRTQSTIYCPSVMESDVPSACDLSVYGSALSQLPDAACCPDVPKAADGLLGGRYELDLDSAGLLGAGQDTVTRSATDVLTNRRVAVKMYLPDKTGRISGRFLRNVNAHKSLRNPVLRITDARLNHESLTNGEFRNTICDLLDFKDETSKGGVAYIVTPLGDESLQQYMDRMQGTAIPAQELIGMMSQILTAVAALHAQGHVLMDLCPSKFVFFQGKLKLVNFGGCHRTGSELLRKAYVPLYASPELQARVDAGEDAELSERLRVTRGSDVWSLGMLLCQLAVLHEQNGAEVFCHEEAAPGWHQRFFQFAEASSGAGALVGLIRGALCAEEPQLRFECAEFLSTTVQETN